MFRYSVFGGELGHSLDLISLGLFSSMAPKLKTRMKPTNKTSTTRIKKRAQPPDLLSSKDEYGPQLQDLMDALATLTTLLFSTEEKLVTASASTPKAPPLADQATRFDLPPQSSDIHARDTQPSPDFGALLDLKEQARARLVARQRGTPTGYFPTTEEESGQEEPPQVSGRREKKGMSGKLRTADNTVSHRVTWPHKVIYSTSAQPATYEQLSTMALVNGYLTVRLREPPHIQVLMLEHLQELMEDGGWGTLRLGGGQCISCCLAQKHRARPCGMGV